MIVSIYERVARPLLPHQVLDRRGHRRIEDKVQLVARAPRYLGRFGLGRLPGDIVIEREGFSLYIPITTCLLISAVVTLGFWLFRK